MPAKDFFDTVQGRIVAGLLTICLYSLMYASFENVREFPEVWGFYVVLIFLVYQFRHLLDWEGIAGLYRTKIGLKLMEKWGKEYNRLVKVLAAIGVFVGYLGMAGIVVMVIYGVWSYFFVENAAPVVSPVLPGLVLPGTGGVQVPLITGWLVLFFVIVIHEFSHGVVSKAYKVRVKSSGLLIFGPLLGAFVEPDEKQLAKKDPKIDRAISAAGPFSNIITTPIFVGFYILVGLWMASFVVDDPGITLHSLAPGLPAEEAGMAPGSTITAVNGQDFTDIDEFTDALSELQPGESVDLQTDAGMFTLIAGENPEDSSKGYLGVNIAENVRLVDDAFYVRWFYLVLDWLARFFFWLAMLSFGIGLANLLPIGPFDGGRLFRNAARHFLGEKKGDVLWSRTSWTLGLILIFLVVMAILPWFLPSMA